MKVIFVVPYPRGEAPSQRFRFEQQIEFLEANGVRCDFHSFWNLKAWRILFKPGHLFEKLIGFATGWWGRFALMFRLHKYDVVFLHREAAPVGPPVIEWFMSKVLRKKIIYDFDDAIWLPNASKVNRFAAPLKNHGKVRAVCKWSWKISCGNEFLAAFAKRLNKNVFVIPTTVDTDYFKPAFQKHSNAKLVIGWTGSLSTNRYIEQMDNVFCELSKFVDFDLVVISNLPPTLSHPYTFIKWRLESEVHDLARIDIGLMPLSDDDWSRGKCAFKLIQYGALKIPSVASPVGANSDVVIHEQTGLLASDDAEWVDALKNLATHAEIRKRMGEKSRARIEERYSCYALQKRYLALLMDPVRR
ncbi:MAG TPA: glycosyltransferase [Chitinophagales bacterium]|nr:glycosyltransferase [Chitinophagales bacterium]